MNAKLIIQTIINEKKSANEYPLLATNFDILKFIEKHNLDKPAIFAELTQLVENNEAKYGSCVFGSAKYYEL